MNIKELKKDKNSILIELKGESVSFANLIKEELWKDKNVEEAVVIKEHPYMDEPKLLVRTKKGTPITAIKKAIKNLQSQTKELHQEFKRDLKE